MTEVLEVFSCGTQPTSEGESTNDSPKQQSSLNQYISGVREVIVKMEENNKLYIQQINKESLKEQKRNSLKRSTSKEPEQTDKNQKQYQSSPKQLINCVNDAIIQNSDVDNDQNIQHMNKETLQKQILHNNNLKKSIFIGICFMMTFTAQNTSQTMISSIFDKMGYQSLGNIALFAQYFAFGIANIFSPSLVRRVSYKICLIIGSSGFIPFMAVSTTISDCANSEDSLKNYDLQCEDKFIYSLVIISCLILGTTQAIYYTAAGNYMDQISSTIPEQRGTYFGIFWSLNTASYLIGAVLGTVLLSRFSNQVFFSFMLILSVFATFLCFFISNQPKPAISQKYCFTLKSDLVEYWELFKLKSLKPLLLYMGFNGVIIAFYTGFLYKLVERSLSESLTPTEITTHTSYVYICLGVGQIVTGYVIGKLSDKLDQNRLAYHSMTIVEIALLAGLLAYMAKSYIICFVCAFLFGFCDCCLQSLISIISSKEYSGKEQIFAVKFLVSSSFLVSTVGINILLKNQEIFYFILIIFLFQIIASYGVIDLKKQNIDELKQKISLV